MFHRTAPLHRHCTSSAPSTLTRKENAMNRFMLRLRSLVRDETGDVPGWVLITLMTAGLVLIIWGLAGPALSGVFQQAMDRVSSF